MKDSVSRRRTHRHAGFTLIEMLVAIALLAMLAVLSWRGLDATIRGRDDIVSSVTQTRLLGRYFSQLQYDMLNLVPPNETGGAPLRIRPDELVLVRRLGAGNGASRVQIVRYRLVGHQLQRSASQPLETLSQLADELHHMDDFASVTASDDVRSMKLAVFLAPGGWTSSQEAIDASYALFLKQYAVSTLATREVSLPHGLRFSITLGKTGDYTRTVMLGE
ncbi:PulJ/GspJ family protein [Paraburkholderia flava]|uniref:PulJ/GspJ family protein n=1 Tax=Paraburkholderia flava TaxID=2547393 RepID=UPI00105E6C20|nr:prepilin-type N-terminal cleavage/methylation domain-containing protein [Paraburkholderia flava]